MKKMSSTAVFTDRVPFGQVIWASKHRRPTRKELSKTRAKRRKRNLEVPLCANRTVSDRRASRFQKTSTNNTLFLILLYSPYFHSNHLTSHTCSTSPSSPNLQRTILTGHRHPHCAYLDIYLEPTWSLPHPTLLTLFPRMRSATPHEPSPATFASRSQTFVSKS